jgi:hypothetical protein
MEVSIVQFNKAPSDPEVADSLRFTLAHDIDHARISKSLRNQKEISRKNEITLFSRQAIHWCVI